jgi:hypothetical protein
MGSPKNPSESLSLPEAWYNVGELRPFDRHFTLLVIAKAISPGSSLGPQTEEKEKQGKDNEGANDS